jgi:hypothetical protein
MRTRMWVVVCVLAAATMSLPPSFVLRAAGDGDFLGRWDITVPGKDGGRARYCWLEVTKEGGALKGRFNSGGGAQFPLAEVSIEKGELKFQYAQGRPGEQMKVVWKAVAKGGKLEGTAELGKDGARSWTAIRCPNWPKEIPKRKAGKPIQLFNGKDISGWLGQIPGRELGWSVKDGIMQNAGANANNIYTEQKFKDFKLDIEFNVDPKSNGGIYLRGRYEIQIIDMDGRPLDVHSIGALYGFVTPPVNAGKPAGEWQKYEITIIANRVTVILNGTKLMENAEASGITGGALDAAEGEPGPIMIQGDHGRVQFRKIQLTPLI